MNSSNINEDQFKTNMIEQVVDQQIIQKVHELPKFIFKQRSTKTVTNMHTPSQNNQDSKILVENFLCKQEDNYLKKVTIITSQCKRIKIQDTYEIQFSSHNHYGNQTKNIQQLHLDRQLSLHQSHNLKKSQRTLFFKRKNMIQKMQSMNSKRDTKNIVKNFIKAFSKHLIESDLIDQERELQQLLHQIGFNNSLIESLITSNVLQKNFEYFLKKEALNWIQNSKIKDKQSHYQGVSLYLQAIQRQKQKDNEV